MILEDEITLYYKSIDRSLFMDKNKNLSDIDSPFSIGYGQTISQPSLVLEMTLLLLPDIKLKTLEIGTGSGYQTALLSKFSNLVFTIERIPQLFEIAKLKLDGFGCQNIHFKLDDGTSGWKEFAPYERIMVTAAARIIPPLLIKQLAPNGRMVIPVGGSKYQELLLITKDSIGNISTEVKGLVQFVPLIGKYDTAD